MFSRVFSKVDVEFLNCRPQRVFVALDIGHGSYTYQVSLHTLIWLHFFALFVTLFSYISQIDFDDFDKTPPAAACADAPSSHPLCSVAGRQTNQKSHKSRPMRRCELPSLAHSNRLYFYLKMGVRANILCFSS